MILPGVRIGEGSIIGAGAAVANDVPPFSIVVGDPAEVVRKRDGYALGSKVKGHSGSRITI